MKDELGGKIMTKFAELRVKKIKKQKTQKSVS